MHTGGLKQWIVAGPERGLGLAEFLARRAGLSGRQAKRLLDARLVFVNRRRVWMARHPLLPGDIVEAPAAPTPPSPDRVQPGLVLLDAGDLLVANKPPGLLANGPDSFESRLRRALDAPGLRAVHRLDRDTSGCLLFARTDEAAAAAKALFEQHGVRKEYLALVAGALPADGLRLERPVEGLSALTLVRTLARRPAASLAAVVIHTGRTHQIRVHLAGAGHPVLGEKKYAPNDIPNPLLREVPRQMLHARVLAFPHPLREEAFRAVAPVPEDFLRFCRRLGLAHGLPPEGRPGPRPTPPPGGTTNSPRRRAS